VHLTDGFSRGRGLGVGLGAVHHMMDDVVVDSVDGRGTRVTATKYVKR
jgi:anti-sigma regulatory factor (Ser/Thr protein kinase)